MIENITFNVDCIMYKSATRKKVSGAYFLIKKGAVEFEISIKRLKFCGRNSTCMIKNQNKTESFFNVVLEIKAPYFTTIITKSRFQFDNLDLIFSSMYRNNSGYSFNVNMEYPNMVSSSVGTTFTISLPSNKSEYYYSIVANENENMAPDIDTLFNNVSVQVRKQSGLTSVLRTDKNNKRGKVLDIKIYSVEEVDSLGNKIEEKGHFIRNFSNQFFNISQVSNALKYGLFATVFNFTLFFGNASISMEFIIFNSSGNILVESGETYHIVPGTMKFNIVIRDWIFCGTQKAACKTGTIGSYLDLQLEMKGAASKTRKTKETKLSNKVKVQKSLKSKYLPISFDIDQSTATFSSMAYINGNWTDMPVGFPRYNNINNNSLFIMRFPLSKSEIIYDPVIEVLPDGTNSSAQLTFIPSTFFVIFFSLASVYVIKV
nr:skeletal aspartic acid-rich protein 1-like [Hydra vulgaris]